MKLYSLSRQLNWVIIKITLYSFFISFAVYLLYFVVIALHSGRSVTASIDMGSTVDWMQIIVSTLLSVLVSVAIAARFARTLLFPLNSLAESARRVADGDLSARAQKGEQRLKEMSGLVDDFNLMAEKLDAMSREIRIWNAAIAHELRTPVTILRGRLQGLEEGIFQPEPQLFHNLVKQTDGLSRLIEDLRVLSLAQSGHLQLHFDHVQVEKEIEAVAALVKDDLTRSHHTLKLELAAVAIHCEPSRLRQAVLVLLENARRYAVPGRVIVSCTARQQGALIVVEDEGPGIGAETAARVWDAFSRGDGPCSQQNGGSGLGLAVVRAIVMSHGGYVDYGRGARGGSRFSLWFPPGPANVNPSVESTVAV
ncbi:hypothetical protein BL250_05120 [Erwinia sp. OLTSP20]|uniref:ATP-binding protein n=1 Tax=unclassified Erwinia TaxID=2622719 RepID=UPI000C17459E|nr:MULTISPECIES: ATP-binding protein [unclassified Erwinia]PIJ50949.1 hypothetical protein BV501_06450 [Erwinia sp. OAMSP11]PIJ75923.1 hypothetical protein BK416_00065 [Erwinia sp. OLSSP12]PIJ83631.1 hypothetical protein BLD47_04270 [Erwinia sp. OLCASP19]PIJ87487.1 hypothetical protein BLD46_00645 [Erwinia sp. OLMTSP26]PIJ89035.1 hypothetical protein BLD49_00640 [Erwinia sp. OLMDSP33]